MKTQVSSLFKEKIVPSVSFGPAQCKPVKILYILIETQIENTIRLLEDKRQIEIESVII